MPETQIIKNKISEIVIKIQNEFFATPLIGSEVEFYLSGDDTKHNLCLADILKTLAENSIQITKLEKESGLNQFEIALSTTSNPVKAAEEILFLKNTAVKVAQKYNLEAIFTAKPFDEQPGSALHINISLLDESGHNLFAKTLDAPETEIMVYSVGGLLETMLANMIYFAPNDCSYKRFTAKKNDAPSDAPMRAYNNSPTNVSWGSNNRTTAIRIPSSTLYAQSRHIEHRVSGADADGAMVILKILEGIYFGIKNQITPPTKIFGNAYDEQYSFLIPFPKSLDEAKQMITPYET
jgi:glutamine synthetase